MTAAVPRFFGYGSLVNLATHEAAGARSVVLPGWRRAWRHTGLRDVAFLTAIPDPDSAIEGVVCEMHGGDWAALDAREFAYDRVMLDRAAGFEGTAIYWIPQGKHAAATSRHPVLLSYLDVVVQGYLQLFGPAGAARFFETTDGWDAPIRDDRAAPLYPRHQVLSADERTFVDSWLDRLGCDVQAGAS